MAMTDEPSLFVEEAAGRVSPDHMGHRERLRSRLLETGPKALQDYEILEFVLFGARPRGDTKPLAKALIRAFGSLAEVLAASPERLRAVEGVSDAVIGSIKIVEAAAQCLAREQIMNQPVLSSWQAVIDFCRTEIGRKEQEEFHLLFLDKKNQLIAMEQHNKGTVDQAAVYVREIVKRALEHSASALILVHNHPSGDPQPSKADLSVTRQIQAALIGVGIEVHDHLIIGRKGHVSFKNQGLL